MPAISSSPGATGEVSTIRGRIHIKQLIEREARQVLEQSYMDRQLGELVSLVESILLDVEQGEVLRTGTYERDLLAVARPRLDWKVNK